MRESGEQTRQLWRSAKMAARVAFSCAALAWVLHKTPLRAIVSSLTSADLPLLVGGLIVNFVARLAAAERTLVISRGFGAWISRWQTIETLFISNFYALLSPGPILSGVVTVYRYRGYGASVSASVGALIASRAIECLLFVALGTACLLIDTRIDLATVRYPLILAATVLAISAIALLVWWRSHRRWNTASSGPQPDPDSAPSGRTAGLMASLRAAQHEVMRRGPGLAFRAAIPAALQVMLAGAAVELLARSVGIELTFVTSIWVTAAVYLVVLLPISVAGVGVREVTLASALALLGINASLAVALSILLFMDPLINALIGGALQLRSSLLRVPRQA
jgi:uncharacterized membrane protein YbhN (UPF0104 family)